MLFICTAMCLSVPGLLLSSQQLLFPLPVGAFSVRIYGVLARNASTA